MRQGSKDARTRAKFAWNENENRKTNYNNLKTKNSYLFHGTLDTSLSGVWSKGIKEPTHQAPRGLIVGIGRTAYHIPCSWTPKTRYTRFVEPLIYVKGLSRHKTPLEKFLWKVISICYTGISSQMNIPTLAACEQAPGRLHGVCEPIFKTQVFWVCSMWVRDKNKNLNRNKSI